MDTEGCDVRFLDRAGMQNGTSDKLNMVELSVKPAPDPEVKGLKQPPSWKQSWIEFTQNTTIHGLRYICMEHSFVFRKFLWLVLVCTCASLMGVQIVDRILYYVGNPTTVNVNVNFNKSLVFPTLTICNQNAFRATAATELNRYRLLEAMYTGKRDLNSSALREFNASDITLDDLVLSTAHSKYDFIVGCEWQREKCGPENFTQVLTDHGVCFTFNDGDDPLLVSSAGSEYGLKLKLNVEQYEYMPGPHDAAGVKMLLHDGKEFPGVAELGLSIPTGTHAYVGIQVVSLENLPEPHGDCGSLSSPFYKTYSTDNCQLACLTEYMEQACGCRQSHMPHRNGTPPICTLERYYGCYLKEIDHQKARMRDECTCPIPCHFLIFDPAISFATTSVFATDRLLEAASTTSKIETKYLRALDVTHRMEATKFRNFMSLEQAARSRLEELSSVMLKVVREAIVTAEATVHQQFSQTMAAWNKKQHLYEWQDYHVQKNFVRPRDAMNERTFAPLCAGFQEFATVTESSIWKLVDPDITQSHDVKTALYTILMTTLTARMDLAERAHDNFTQLYESYYNGTPIFRYKFEDEPRAMNINITPRPLLRHALVHSDYTVNFSGRVGDDILKIKKAVARFAELATQAYVNGTVDSHDMYLADVQFLFRGRQYLNSLSVFFYESIEYPVRVMQQRREDFAILKRQYETAMRETMDDIENLKLSLERLENTILKNLMNSMLLVHDYVNLGNVTKLDIARELTSQSIYGGISDLQLFFQSLRSRGQRIYDNWGPMMESTVDIWRTILDDEDMLEFYTYNNMAHFLRNATELAGEIKVDYDNYRQQFDFRFLVGNADSQFLKSLDDLMTDMDRYIKISNIELSFIRDNFLQLDVFYREKNYEQITQQQAYDIFALLCDIGGSMGLFVGASVMSIGELIDLVLHQSLYRITHGARK